MTDSLPPIRRDVRHRVAVPVQTLKPSLIPHDVMADVQREAQVRPEETFDQEPRTAPVPVIGEAPVRGQMQADLEVAYFALTQVPLFRDLPARSIEAMAADSLQIEVPHGEFLFREGEDATSFFVVIDGALELLRHKDGREVAFRHAKKGEAFGLFGLFSAQLRAASARAIGDCTVLELDSQRLQKILQTDDVLHARLLSFYRERLVESFMSGRLFSDLDSIARARLIGRFQHRELEAKTELMSPGEVKNLIAVVTHGRLVLEDRSALGGAPRHLEVTQGQFLAVTCAVSGLPSKLRIFAPEFATVSLLSHRDLVELMRDYPALRSLSRQLPNYARALDRDVFCGATGVPGL